MPPVDPAVAAANAAKAQSDADELRRRMPHLFAFETKSTDDDVAAPLTAPAAPAPVAAAAATASPTPSASPSSAPAVPATDASAVAALTVKTVHTLTTFELRRELERRGLLSAELVARAAYEPFLAALVVALNEDQERVDAASAARAQVEHAQKMIELKERRAARKAEAVARSLARQQTPDYFGKEESTGSSSTEGGDGGSASGGASTMTTIELLKPASARREISISGVQSRRVNLAVQPAMKAAVPRKSRWEPRVV
jgi:hypothetical protein